MMINGDFQKWGYPKMDGTYWQIMENPTSMDDDWGYPHSRKPPYVAISMDYLWVIQGLSMDYLWMFYDYLHDSL